MTTANQRTGQDITVDTARLEQWYWGGLSGAERAEVRRLVVEEPAWREAYRAEVARKARVVPCRFGRDELDADRWRSAEERGRPVFTLPLPHTGDLAQLAVYVGAGQSHWYWLDGDSEREAHRDLASTAADDEQTLAGLYEAPGWHQLRDDASWGAWILYQSQTDGSLKVYLRLRVEAEDADPAELQWSPDGEELIQHLNRGNGREFMFRIWPATFSFACSGLLLEIVVREPGDGAS
jgi:hypothetical protein